MFFKTMCCIVGVHLFATHFLMAQNPVSSSNDKEAEAIGRAAVVGYRTNVDAFRYYSCRYRYTKGECLSVEDGRQGKFINATSYDNRLLVSGQKDLYEGLASPVTPDPKNATPLQGKKGLFVAPADVDSDRYLNDGQRQANYCPQLQSINLFSVDKSPRRISHTPLGMHFVGHRSDHGPDVFMAQSDHYEMLSLGREQLDGRIVVTVQFKDKQDGDIRKYSFDPKRGYLPIHMAAIQDEKIQYQVFVTDFRECSNHRWFPERSVVLDTPLRTGQLYAVAEIRLLELDPDRRPAESDFSFRVPAGTSVLAPRHYQDGRIFFKLKQDEQIHVDNLPKLFDMLSQVKATPRMDTAIPRPNPYRWVTWIGWGVGIVLVASGAGILLWRRLLRPRMG